MNKELEGFVYISEQTTPEDYQINNLEVHDKNGVFFVSFLSGLHSFSVINRNNRQYLSNNVIDCINKSSKIQALLKDNAWFGERDHPRQDYENVKLTPERVKSIDMKNRSHKILEPRLDSNMLIAKIETSSGTEAGRGMAQDIIQGLNPAFSCRAIAGMHIVDRKPTVICRQVITYDWVLYPSHVEAHPVGDIVGKVKSIKTVTESAVDKVKKYSEDILIPLKEILENVGHRDVNTRVIMESFELSDDNMIGFTNDKSHVIIKDGTNTVYSKISPETVKDVKDFYASF